MLPEKEFTDTDGRLVSTFNDMESGLGLVVGSRGGVVKITVYKPDGSRMCEYAVSQGGSLKLSDALKKAAYHGK